MQGVAIIYGSHTRPLTLLALRITSSYCIKLRFGFLLNSPDVIHCEPVPLIYPAEYLPVKIAEKARVHLDQEIRGKGRKDRRRKKGGEGWRRRKGGGGGGGGAKQVRTRALDRCGYSGSLDQEMWCSINRNQYIKILTCVCVCVCV